MTAPDAREPRRPEPYVCTAAAPWKPEHGTPARHPDAKCTYDGGWEQEYERYKCPHCGKSFTTEIPQ